jgi:hypothetical protein
MSLIGLVLTLVVVGVLLWLLNNYVPMDAKIKSIINIVVVIVVVIWLLQAFGCWARCKASAFGDVRRTSGSLRCIRR